VKNLVIAKRYAKALFDLALDGGWIGQYGRELTDFVRLMNDVPQMANAIQSPLYPEPARLGVFSSVAEKAGLSPVVKSFISLLIEKRRVQHLPEIAEYYHKLIDEHSNVAQAQLTSATELDEQVLNDIAQTLEKMTGKKIVIQFEQDPSLIGGIVARIGDLVLDGSVKRQLLTFKESMKRGALS